MSEAISPPSSAEYFRPDLVYIVRLTCVALLVTFGVLWRCYLPGYRLYAPVPLFEGLGGVPVWADRGLFIILVSGLLWLLVSPLNRSVAAIVLACALFFITQDINRLQAYFYMYYFTLFIAAVSPREGNAAINSLRIMVIGVYFWAGFHKINKTFFLLTLPWFIAPLHVFAPPSASPALMDVFFVTLVFTTPFFESLIGILLLFPKARDIATAMAFAMLVTVLYCLGPFGHNWEKDVWPWNIWLFLMELRLFMNAAGNRGFSFRVSEMKGLPAVSVLLFCLAPVTAMFVPWYAYLGFKLYSGNVVTAKIILPDDETLAKAPPFLKKVAAANRGFEYNTVAEHYGVTFFPDPYVIKKSTSGLCPYLDKPDGAILRLYAPPPFYEIRDKHKDIPLCR